MGRHSAPRRHAPVMVLGAAAVVGTAGIAWAVGGGSPDEGPNPARTGGPAAVSVPVVTAPAPTPSATATGAPVVSVVASPTTQTTSTTPDTTATSAPAPTPTPTPTQTKPGKGGRPTAKPTKSGR